jgi:uncharacterized repeat protein (TIGR03837 family)
MLWDVFCQVIDNYGDLGVCWRLSCQLATRGDQVRLWVDDASALTWMAPSPLGHARINGRVQLLKWAGAGPQQTAGQHAAAWPEPGDVVIEAFGCTLPDRFVHRMASKARVPAWINLEYLSAEPFVERCHGLPSPVMHGPGTGLVKHFFYPGFTDSTGGLLREPDLAQRQTGFDRRPWLDGLGLNPDAGKAARWVSLFCYEPPALSALTTRLEQAACPDSPIRLLVTSGRAAAAVKAVWAAKSVAAPSARYFSNENGLWRTSVFDSSLSISYLPKLSQIDFDHLLWACDLNFVRGEDSLVRAIWAGKPMVWQAYAQHDNAHHAKLESFLDWLDASADLRAWHHAWNGLGTAALTLDPLWRDQAVANARAGLLQQDDLVTRLIRFRAMLAT